MFRNARSANSGNVAFWHIAVQSQFGGMSAGGESGLCVVIATLRQGQRITAWTTCSSKQPPNLWPVALALLLGRRGRRAWRCPHSAKGDMRALNEGSGFDPQETWAAPDFRSAKPLFVASLKRGSVAPLHGYHPCGRVTWQSTSGG